MRRGDGRGAYRRCGPPVNPRGGFGNARPVQPVWEERGGRFQSRCSQSLPPLLPCPSNFIIELRHGPGVFKKVDVKELLADCKVRPEKVSVQSAGPIAAVLYFRQWVETLETMVHLWEYRLVGRHFLTPKLIRNIIMPSDEDDLRDRLRATFGNHIRAILECEEVNEWQNELLRLSGEIARVQGLLRKPNKLPALDKLTSEREGLVHERGLISKRLIEFKSSMTCILNYLEGKHSQECCDGEIEVFRFNGDFDWNRFHHLIVRECRRLRDGLPIYAFRQEILQQIYEQQVIYLIDLFFFMKSYMCFLFNRGK